MGVPERDADAAPDDGGPRFGAEAFASARCWGRRPFLMRNAFDPALLLGDDCCAWPSWEDVVDVATDEDAEARIVSHVPGDRATFAAAWGPLDARDADAWVRRGTAADAPAAVDPPSSSRKGRRREALVVNDVDRFHPPLADWMRDAFPFLPHWRADDAQVSLAEEGGGIGPHVDNYDVFLIQASGTRTWRVGRRRLSAQEEEDGTIEGLDVRVLRDWGGGEEEEEDEGTATEEYAVRPGDLLYLPPRFAHCGTATSGRCMTLSVGCRAPSASDLVGRLAERLASSSSDEVAARRYTDEGLFGEADGGCELFPPPGELTAEAKERARRLVLDSLTALVEDEDWWDDFLGRYVTEQKRARDAWPVPLHAWCAEGGDLPEDGSAAAAAAIVRSVLAGEGALIQAEGIAFAYSTVPSNVPGGRERHRLFVDGARFDDGGRDGLARLFRAVADRRRLDRAALLGSRAAAAREEDAAAFPPGSAEFAFLEELVSTGLLYASED